MTTASGSAALRERGITFTPENVPLILRRQKTQTRRLVNANTLKIRTRKEVSSHSDWLGEGPAPWPLVTVKAQTTARARIHEAGAVTISVGGRDLGLKPGEFDFVCPYGYATTESNGAGWQLTPLPNQRLWGREEWGFSARVSTDLHSRFLAERDTSYLVYRAGTSAASGWRSARYMPRWASRFTVVATRIRIERRQDVSEDDAKAEGVPLSIPAELCTDHRAEFRELWDRINEMRAPWAANPWVWAISFDLIEGVRS